MPVRQVVLGVGALLVLGLGVYLFLEVRSQPAEAHVEPGVRRPATAAVTEEPARREPTPPPTRTAPRPSPNAGRPSVAAEPARPTTLEAAPMRPVIRGQFNTDEPGQGPDHKLVSIMAEANKAYDRGDLDEAKSVASKVLVKDPHNVRMLRIMTSASCIEGDANEANKHYALLPEADRAQMRVRCDRYGVTFPANSPGM